MITAQDIREKTFERSFNGYNMGQVDEFLDEISSELSALAKENAALKGKMRVLVEKVEEYRQTEDSMRLALMSAQKMSAQIEQDAQKKADALLAQARESADSFARNARDSIANEEAKLEEAKKATQKFFDHMRMVCEKQIEFYGKLDQMNLVGGNQPSASEPAPAPVTELRPTGKASRAKDSSPVEDTVKSIETSIANAPIEPETITIDTDIPEEEEEPTRLFSADEGRKNRSFDEFRFDDDI